MRGRLTIDIIPEIAPISSLFSTCDFAKNQPLDSLVSPEWERKPMLSPEGHARQAKGNKALKARYSKAQGGGREAAETLG